MTTPTPAMFAFEAAHNEAVAFLKTLPDAKAGGLAVALDIGVSAAFLFDVSDTAYTNATNVINTLVTNARSTVTT